MLKKSAWISAFVRANKVMRLQTGEMVPHTGQQFEVEDPRNVRYRHYRRLVNPNVSYRIMKETEPIRVKTRIYGCGGGKDARGHPVVYINLDQPGEHVCGYCGAKYVYEE